MNLTSSKNRRYIFCFKTTRFFFLCGSFLFFIQLIVQDLTYITVIGYYYLGIAILINLLILFGLLFALIFKPNKLDTLKSIGILTANIPIAIVYTLIVINYLI